MKLIRAILRHSLLLAIVVAAGLAYYYRDDLLPKFYEKVADLRSVSQKYLPGGKSPETPPEKQTPAVAGEPVPDQEVATEVAPATAGVPETEVTTATPVTAESDIASEPPVEMPEPLAESAPAVVPPTSAPQRDLSRYRPLIEDDKDTSSEPASSSETGVTTLPALAESDTSEGASEPETKDVAPDRAATTEQPLTPSVEPPASSATEPVSPAVDAQEQERLRVSARSAFWLHDYQKAEDDYKALAELEPSSPDAYGELGNVYFSQGKWDLAAESFYQAAVRLIRMGEEQRARDLLVIIRGLDPEKSRQLEEQLTQAQGGAGN